MGRMSALVLGQDDMVLGFVLLQARHSLAAAQAHHLWQGRSTQRRRQMDPSLIRLTPSLNVCCASFVGGRAACTIASLGKHAGTQPTLPIVHPRHRQTVLLYSLSTVGHCAAPISPLGLQPRPLAEHSTMQITQRSFLDSKPGASRSGAATRCCKRMPACLPPQAPAGPPNKQY